MVYVEFLPLLDARNDYRRVFLVIPWAALVAIYLLLGIPLYVFALIYGAGHEWAFPGVDPFFGFSKLYHLDRHARLRSSLASRSLLVFPMMLLFILDSCFYFVATAIGWLIAMPIGICYSIPPWIMSSCFIRYREGEIDAFQHTCCQCLTQRACEAELGEDFSFEKEACHQCKIRDTQWIWMGCRYANRPDDGWIRTARETGELLHAPGSMLVNDPDLAALRFPKHVTELPQWLSHCSSTSLTSLELSGCRCLEKLPLADILKFTQLTSLSCEGCSQLWSIPRRSAARAERPPCGF
jgi:hypothetical protein